MRRSFRLLFISILMVAVATPVALAQKITTIEGKYNYVMPNDESFIVARNKAIDQARINGLAKEFGTIVSSSSYYHVDNSQSSFMQFGMNDVKGEWIEDVSEPEVTHSIDPTTQHVVISARVKFKAREVHNESVNVEAKVLRNGTLLRNEDSNFMSGDDMFIRFKAPVDGYLVIYISDGGAMVDRLLPYSRSTASAYKVQADSVYTFFSPAHHKMNESFYDVDPIVMTASKPMEWNRFSIIFSPNEFSMPADEIAETASGEELGVYDYARLELNRRLKNEDFQKWLGKHRSRDRKMSYTPIDITVTRK